MKHIDELTFRVLGDTAEETNAARKEFAEACRDAIEVTLTVRIASMNHAGFVSAVVVKQQIGARRRWWALS